MKHLYADKPSDYYQSARKEILPLLPPGRMRVLELGCGEGATLAWLKNLDRCAESVGIEIFENAAIKARDIADRVVVADIERDDIAFADEYFDCILCLDVLEHLQDPWRVLRRLAAWLRPGGTVVVSIPNLRYKSVLIDLALRGEFKYGSFGILDRTHLRFFTRSSAIALLESAGLTMVKVLPQPAAIAGISSLVNALTFGYFREVWAWQYLLAGVKEGRLSPDRGAMQVGSSAQAERTH